MRVMYWKLYSCLLNRELTTQVSTDLGHYSSKEGELFVDTFSKEVVLWECKYEPRERLYTELEIHPASQPRIEAPYKHDRFVSMRMFTMEIGEYNMRNLTYLKNEMR